MRIKKIHILALAGTMLAAIAGTQPMAPAIAASQPSITAAPIQSSSAAASAKFNMSYLYFGIPGDYVRQVDAAKGALQEVAPSFFELNADGSLKLSTAASDTFIKAMHDRGIRVVPFLSNEWDRSAGESALQQRDKLSTDLAAAVSQYNLDGVDIDIENVTEADRDAYTDLMRMLREKLPQGKTLSVAVMPNLDGSSTGVAAAYNYKELAGYCDYLMLMAYDESYPGDPTPGPVASLPFVEHSIQAMLKDVSPDKLVLGVPFYGRLWNSQDTSFNGMGLSNKLAETLIARYGGKVGYDKASESPYAAFTIGPNSPASVLLGRTLTPGSYTIWYENDSSMKAKLSLVSKYNLKGTGSWSLSQETADTWDYYPLWLNGKYFSDAAGHWAETYILTVAEKGWMTGESDDTFAPDRALTRAEAAAVLVRALGLSAAEGQSAAPFSDVPAGYWAAQEIAIAAQHGYVDGFGDGKFAPDRPITREQISALLARLLGVQTAAVSTPPFMDVPAAAWSAPAIAALSARGIVDGYADGTFRPQAPITRAQMAALLARIMPSLAGGSAQ